jgi:hypothetical protein
MQGDIKSHNLPTIVGQDDHYTKQSKRCGSHDKPVDGGNALGLTEQETMPDREGVRRFRIVLGDPSLADLDDRA